MEVSLFVSLLCLLLGKPTTTISASSAWPQALRLRNIISLLCSSNLGFTVSFYYCEYHMCPILLPSFLAIFKNHLSYIIWDLHIQNIFCFVNMNKPNWYKIKGQMCLYLSYFWLQRNVLPSGAASDPPSS